MRGAQAQRIQIQRRDAIRAPRAPHQRHRRAGAAALRAAGAATREVCMDITTMNGLLAGATSNR